MATNPNTVTAHPTNLADYLDPASLTVAPDVKDENGNVVVYNQKITNERIVVDLGDSPNSNTGDPLRLAFVKINNFIEAAYQVNRAIDSEIQSLSTEIDGGAF
jgi:hypothetical protein